MSTALVIGIVVTVAVVAVLIRVAAWSMSPEKMNARILHGAPRATAAELADGAMGRLTGVVTADGTMRAPLTGRACVAYVARVEERVSQRNGGRWVERVHEVRGVPFTLDDGSGRALIDPGQSTMMLQMDSTTRSGRFDDPTLSEVDFLARHNVASTGLILNKTLRYTEGVLEPGERVAILGRGVREPDPAGGDGYLGGPPTRVRLGGTDDDPILVTDRADLIGS